MLIIHRTVADKGKLLYTFHYTIWMPISVDAFVW